jgi:hypothetical protein
MKTYLSLVLAVTLASALAASCKKAPDKAQEKKAEAPSAPIPGSSTASDAPEGNPSATPGAVSGAAVRQEAEPPKKKEVPLLPSGGSPQLIQGPPLPPVNNRESVVPADLLEWKQVPHQRNGTEERQFPSPLDAALDPDKVKNRASMLFDLTRDANLATIDKKYFPTVADYTEFLRYLGYTYTVDEMARLTQHVHDQVARLSLEYGEFVQPLEREDKLFGQYRLARYTFEYKDKAGVKQEGCYLMMLSEMTWRILDMECKEWYQK